MLAAIQSRRCRSWPQTDEVAAAYGWAVPLPTTKSFASCRRSTVATDYIRSPAKLGLLRDGGGGCGGGETGPRWLRLGRGGSQRPGPAGSAAGRRSVDEITVDRRALIRGLHVLHPRPRRRTVIYATRGPVDALRSRIGSRSYDGVGSSSASRRQSCGTPGQPVCGAALGPSRCQCGPRVHESTNGYERPVDSRWRCGDQEGNRDRMSGSKSFIMNNLWVSPC